MKHGRKFSKEHVEAGYADHDDWGPIPTPKDQIIGTYDSPIAGTIAVRYLEKGPTGNPELELEWEDGSMVTVIDAATAFQYLDSNFAVKH